MKESDMPSVDLNPYVIVKALLPTVQAQYVEGVQRIGQLWRIYVNSVNIRVNLLTRGNLVINGKMVPLYEQNPFTTHQRNPQNRKNKLTVKDCHCQWATLRSKPFWRVKELFYRQQWSMALWGMRMVLWLILRTVTGLSIVNLSIRWQVCLLWTFQYSSTKTTESVWYALHDIPPWENYKPM